VRHVAQHDEVFRGRLDPLELPDGTLLPNITVEHPAQHEVADSVWKWNGIVGRPVARSEGDHDIGGERRLACQGEGDGLPARAVTDEAEAAPEHVHPEWMAGVGCLGDHRNDHERPCANDEIGALGNVEVTGGEAGARDSSSCESLLQIVHEIAVPRTRVGLARKKQDDRTGQRCVRDRVAESPHEAAFWVWRLVHADDRRSALGLPVRPGNSGNQLLKRRRRRLHHVLAREGQRRRVRWPCPSQHP
jgi:hypothetical protein